MELQGAAGTTDHEQNEKLRSFFNEKSLLFSAVLPPLADYGRATRHRGNVVADHIRVNSAHTFLDSAFSCSTVWRVAVLVTSSSGGAGDV
jgi:hypothetical protein